MLAAIVIFVFPACDFFQELESLPEAGEDESGGGSETGESFGETEGEPCTVLDDYCSNQDTLHTCNAETGVLETYSCATLCGESLLNFTCTPTDSFAHACWCVSPGEIKISTCVQLEQCINACGDPDSDCSASCFGDTDAQTVRLLGTLYSCADRACDELCVASPDECGSCLAAARAGLWGDCGVEREVCDADQSDEPTWP